MNQKRLHATQNLLFDRFVGVATVRPASGVVLRMRNTATERRRRYGVFFGAKVSENVISASAEIKKDLHGELITAA